MIRTKKKPEPEAPKAPWPFPTKNKPDDTPLDDEVLRRTTRNVPVDITHIQFEND